LRVKRARLKKKSPKTTVAKKAVDAWQRRYFVLSGGELRYFKTEKAAHMSNGESLKSIRLDEVLCATANPRHTDSFVVDLGRERKVKLQAGSEAERDAWVAAIEAAKGGRPSTENMASNGMAGSTARQSPGGATAAASAKPFGSPASARDSGNQDAAIASPTQIEAELLHNGTKSVGCCVVM